MEMLYTKERRGYLLVACAAALWAFSGTASKFLFNSGITPFQLVQLRSTIAAVSLFLWLLLGRRRLLRIKWRDLPYFAHLGVVLAATHFTYLYAISRVQVAAAILLQYQAPVFIVAYAVIIRRRRPLFPTLLAVSGSVSGCYLMVGAYNVDLLNIGRAGIISGLASAVFFGWYAVKSEDGMRTYSPWTVLVYALIIAGGIWNILLPPLSAFAGPYEMRSWFSICFIGIFGTIAAFGLYNQGIRLISSTRASITATLEPVIAGGISYFFIGEGVETLQLAGAVLIIASILFLQTREKVYADQD